MKKIFTVSMDEELVEAIKSLVKSDHSFRSQSHFVEKIIKDYLSDGEEEGEA